MFDNGDYPFLDVLWTALIFFAWFVWIWMAIVIFGDIIRRRDAGGGTKVLWSVFIVFAPFLGVLVYLLVNGRTMAERNVQAQAEMQAQFDDHVRSVAGSGDATSQIAQAKQLLDTGAITNDEFASIKRKALG